MQKDKHLVSVVITNYNYGRYIKEALDSVLAQTYKNIELIVIDDGSTDNSVEIIDEYKKAHPEVKVIKQKNSGVVAARNKGIAISTGNFLLLMDADDIIPASFIKGMYETAVKNNADVVYCDLVMFGEVTGHMNIEAQNVENLKNFLPSPICQLIRKDTIRDVRFDPQLKYLAHEDNDFFFSLFSNGAKFAKSDQIYNYRIHHSARNPDDKHKKHYESILYIYLKHMNRYPQLKDAIVDLLIAKDEDVSKWHAIADERLALIENNKMINDLKSTITQRDKIIDDLLNSKRYKIGKMILTPISAAKAILKGKEQNK